MKKDVENQNAQFRYSPRTGEIEISGSESFVSDQISNFTEEIRNSLQQLALKDSVQQLSSFNSSKTYTLPDGYREDSNTEEVDYIEAKEDAKGSREEYENVIAIDGDTVKVIADVPGNTTTKKMINVVLIYLWAKKRLGIDEVAFKELRDVCEEYGEIDKPNFSSTMNNQRKFFLIGGSGKSQTAKLIRPGEKEAEKLIKELNSND